MASVSESIKYPLSMTVILIGFGAVLLALLLDLVLADSMVAGLLGLWGLIVAGIGLFGVAVTWAVGKLD